MRKTRENDPEGFAEWWAVWRPVARHTDGRGLAREAYRKHILNGAEPADILDGARWFIRNLTERDRAYVPLSATWLNRETWADLAPMEREYQARLQARSSENVVPIRSAPLPENHFLSRLERGEVQLPGGGLKKEA